jgi:hypothetical protein
VGGTGAELTLGPAEPTLGPDGLCGSCRHGRTIVSRKGSRFLLCELSRTDRRFPRYPPLPVLSCPGFDPARTDAPSTSGASDE